MLALTAAAVLGIAALGRANSASVADARGDVIGKPPGGADAVDIVRTAYGHAKRRRLVHTVTVAGRAADPAGSSGVVPTLWIDVEEGPGRGARECDFMVGRLFGRLGVYECGSLDRVASARVTRTGEHGTRYVFAERAIGSPAEYGWSFVTEGPTDGTWIRYDRVPEGDHAFAPHRLR